MLRVIAEVGWHPGESLEMSLPRNTPEELVKMILEVYDLTVVATTPTKLVLAKTSLPNRQGLFNDFWDQYGKKVGKIEAQKAWQRLSAKEQSEALAGVQAYVKQHPDPQYRLDPVRYLKYKRWNDEPAEQTPQELRLYQAVVL